MILANKHSNTVSVPAQSAIISIDIKTGLKSVARLDDKRNYGAPVFDEDAECPVFDAILHSAFSLAENTDAVIYYFWECIGILLMPHYQRQKEVVFFGSSTAKQQQIKTILKPVLDKTAKIKTVVKHPRGPFSDEHISNTLLIPFYGHSPFVNGEVLPFSLTRRGEDSGIFNKAINGLQRALRRGFVGKPKDISMAEKRYFSRMDPLGSWIDARLTLVSNPEVAEPYIDLFHDFCNWSPTRMTKPTFILEMESRGIELVRDIRGLNKMAGVILDEKS